MNIILIPCRRRVLYAGSILQYATSRDICWMCMPDVGDGIYVCYHIINKCIASYLLCMQFILANITVYSYMLSIKLRSYRNETRAIASYVL